ncbi:VacJ family lipoprotein [Pseudomonas mohnii]|jgi:phospholipid-binding lipoprotein MlaA|nr:VacJ family lipoprotein [Pseudomonas sp. MIL9]MBH8609934.1 VacJ family lipoprotein [Pseudomonas mohnii]MBM6446214.1 VacJ family lipoprotein [Pseudomonas sp. MIL9]RZO07695.1 VacJ family lipoprotein [Pseudomonas moorei]
MERRARTKPAYFIQWEINMCAYRSTLSRCVQVLTCAGFITLSPLAWANSDADPWEGINRPIFSFNDTLDTYALKPLAQGYQFVTPRIAQDGIHNVFNNLGEVKNLANNLLQAKFHSAGVDTSRFLLNSTVGLVGLIDIATPMGLRRSDEDFGQTLGHWGVNSGPYLVLPLLGPSTLRDAPAVLPDAYANPVRYIGDVPTRNSLYGVGLIDGRAQYIKSEKLITGDKYNFIRSVYLQSREFKIRAGNVEDDF